MKKMFRVWNYGSAEYQDVKGKSVESVARRFFGKSKNMQFHHDIATDTWTIAITGKVKGKIKEYDY